MHDHNNFIDNLEFGNKAERRTAKLLHATYNLLTISFNNDHRYDILMHSPRLNKRITFEVKDDTRTKETGNIVVEHESWGKPSGITTTEADYWVFSHHSTYHIIETPALKSLISTNSHFDNRQMQHTDYFFTVPVIARASVATLEATI